MHLWQASYDSLGTTRGNVTGLAADVAPMRDYVSVPLAATATTVAHNAGQQD